MFTHVAMAPAFKLVYKYGTTASHIDPTDEMSCVATEQNYSCTSVIHLYMNHCQF
jgi:hypothetical protein